MTAIYVRNQEHPPLPKKKRVDAQGNNRKRMFFKKGDSSMLFARGVTKETKDAFELGLRDLARKLGITIEGSFFCAQGK